MDRFDKNGMMTIPHVLKPQAETGKKLLVVKECYCPNGHSLIDAHACFNDQPGIMLEVTTDGKTGKLALSPIYGQKARISIGTQLNSGDKVALACPECHASLHTHSRCDCGADILAMFLTMKLDFSDCIGICQRVDCHHSYVTASGELLTKFDDELLLSD